MKILTDREWANLFLALSRKYDSIGVDIGNFDIKICNVRVNSRYSFP